MAREKRPFMPFYGREFYGDIHVEEMSFAQQGMYLKLCWLAWTEGSIPSEPARVARILRIDEAEFVRDHAAILLPRFHGQSDGTMVHRKVERIRTAAEEFSAAQSERANRRWAKRREDAEGVPAECRSDAGIMLPISDIQSPIENQCASTSDARISDFKSPHPKPKEPDQRDAWFDAFWLKYKTWRTDDKKRARLKFLAIVKNEATFREVLAGFDEQNAEMLRRDPSVRPYAKSWLHGECWKREGGELAPTIGPASTTRPNAPQSLYSGDLELYREEWGNKETK